MNNSYYAIAAFDNCMNSYSSESYPFEHASICKSSYLIHNKKYYKPGKDDKNNSQYTLWAPGSYNLSSPSSTMFPGT